jgi:hypothetical protein
MDSATEPVLNELASRSAQNDGGRIVEVITCGYN